VTEAVAPRTKKRRTEADRREEPDGIESLPPQDLQPLPPAMGALRLHPESTSHRQEPPPDTGGGQGEDVDRISSLPDVILGEIISLLPTKDGVRTQTLASRWRHLWLSTPLNLDHKSMPTDVEAQVDIISQILAAHPGPVRRFSVLQLDDLYYLDSWLRSPALDHLQELEVEDGATALWRSLPASAFRFTTTLRVFTMSGCHLLDETVETFQFPQLRQLSLDRVRISEVALHGIISRCPVLEYLLLNSTGFRCLRINSPSLKSVAISSACSEELIIEDAPLLQRLLQLQPRCVLNVSVISAPKVETLGCLGYDSNLLFGTSVIQRT